MQGFIPPTSPRLISRAVACRRGARLLLAGIDFDLAAGGALQLVGSNGIGKSSLLRLLAGLARPFAGLIESRGSIGLLDDRDALDPELALAQALAFWAGLDGAGPDKVASVAARLGLDRLGEVPVAYLSTGQRRRAQLARLICQDARIWLLDEVLNGLDAASAALAQNIVAEHLSAGGIAVVASHQPFEAPGMIRLDLARHIPCEPDDFDLDADAADGDGV